MNAAPPSPATADLDPRTLARVRDLVHGIAGIVVSDRKGSMVRARLAKRLLATGHRDLDAYLDHVEGSAGAAELTQLIAAMTTNVTRFFREDHHFNALAAEVVPRWEAAPGVRSVWSAGCSTGQEPYSIAMTLKDAGLNRGTARILATDIDRTVLDRARCGDFLPREVADIPGDLLQRHFQPTTDGWEAGPELRRLITFRALNLVGPSGPSPAASTPSSAGTLSSISTFRPARNYGAGSSPSCVPAAGFSSDIPSVCQSPCSATRSPISAGPCTRNPPVRKTGENVTIRERIQILVVDDMSTSRGLIVQALESFGIANIHHAADGTQAVAAVAVRPVHLVISDYNMPGMDGLTLLGQLRQNPATRGVGFILVTGRADQELVNKGRALGMNNFLRKPFTTAELKSCLEAVVGRL